MFCFCILVFFDWIAKLNDMLIYCCAWHCVIQCSDSFVLEEGCFPVVLWNDHHVKHLRLLLVVMYSFMSSDVG